ncbi:hypothetical protein D9M71_783620 [compost metagenome]
MKVRASLPLRVSLTLSLRLALFHNMVAVSHGLMADIAGSMNNRTGKRLWEKCVRVGKAMDDPPVMAPRPWPFPCYSSNASHTGAKSGLT